jgi:hypothetical protein
VPDRDDPMIQFGPEIILVNNQKRKTLGGFFCKVGNLICSMGYDKPALPIRIDDEFPWSSEANMKKPHKWYVLRCENSVRRRAPGKLLISLGAIPSVAADRFIWFPEGGSRIESCLQKRQKFCLITARP